MKTNTKEAIKGILFITLVLGLIVIGQIHKNKKANAMYEDQIIEYVENLSR